MFFDTIMDPLRHRRGTVCNAPGGLENRSEKWTYFWSRKMIRKNWNPRQSLPRLACPCEALPSLAKLCESLPTLAKPCPFRCSLCSSCCSFAAPATRPTRAERACSVALPTGDGKHLARARTCFFRQFYCKIAIPGKKSACGAPF